MKKIKILLVLFILLSSSQNLQSQIEIDARYVILQDHFSGEILYEKDADAEIYPASMTKIMTTIVVFDLIKKGEVSLDEKISKKFHIILYKYLNLQNLNYLN